MAFFEYGADDFDHAQRNIRKAYYRQRARERAQAGLIGYPGEFVQYEHASDAARCESGEHRPMGAGHAA